jgi:putative sigma-54 modulation protein
MEPSRKIKEYGLDKLAKLDKYVDSVIDAEITFTVEKHRHRVAVVLSADGGKIAAEQESDDMYSCVDLVVDKLEKQLKRRREKSRQNHGKNPASLKELAADEADDEAPSKPGNGHGEPDADAALPPGAKILDLPLRTLSLDEAVDKISQSSLPYLVFLDDRDGRVRLLRHAGGGSLELARFHPHE